jgi:heptosyltransferase-2
VSSTRVLVIRFGSVGDVVLAGAATAALRAARPDLRICFVTREPFAALAALLPGVDEVLAIGPDERLIRFAERVRREGVAGIVDLHTSLRSVLLRWLLRPARIARWARRPRWRDLLVRWGWLRARNDVTIAARYHRGVEAFAGRSLPPSTLGLRVEPDAVAAVRALLDAQRVAADAPTAALVPGANWATKRWPAERFAELASHLLTRGVTPLVVGGPGEEALTRGVVQAAPGAVDLGATVPIALLPALLAGCRVVVAHDSGPMHVARAVGTPTVAVFGSTDPAAFDFSGHAVHASPPACAPCHPYGRPACPRGHLDCLRRLESAPAVALLDRLLAAGRSPPVGG